MHRSRALAFAFLFATAASVGTPFVQSSPAQEERPTLPGNPFCLRAGCGYGRDGIPAPYAGGGLRGSSARAMQQSADSIFQSSNAAMLSWVTGRDITGTPVNANDVWGYVSPSGREYAVVGLVTGTAFVEITNPANPDVVGFIPGAASDWRDMAVYDEYAYSVNESDDGVQVIDLGDIDNGKVSLVRNVTANGLRTAHNIYVNPDSGYAYVLGANIARGGLVMLDLANPREPTMAPAMWETAYVHDVLVVSFARGKNKGREIAFAFTGNLGLHIVDVTDKSNPTTVGHLLYDNARYGHSGALSPNGRFLYVNDELDERGGVADGMTTYVIRVGKLAKPKLTRTIVWDTGAVDHNSMVQGDRMFISAYSAGLRIVDVRKDKNPQPYGYFDTHPEAEGPLFNGAWGVFAGFPSGTVIVTDITRGLFVIRPS